MKERPVMPANELKPIQKMESCYRCGERKEDWKFREGQNYWHRWCIRCESSPIGQMPIPETSEHRRPLTNYSAREVERG